MPRTKNYTDVDVINAVKESVSIRQVLQKLNLKAAGGNYNSIRSLIKNLEIDTTHFTGQLWSKGRKLGYKRPISDYTEKGVLIQSHKLRLMLLNQRVFLPQCSKCLLTTWLDQPIALELEHIDGNHDNNALSNLCLLCPNCHAQTPTYRGKNIKLRSGLASPK